MTHFKPIKTARIFEDVLLQLKEAILLGRFKSGDKLPSERELTLEFQVSRGVIREAIRALELSGFVVIRQGPAGGAFVTELTFNQVGNAFLDLFLSDKLSMREIAQVRLHVEPEVARLAALHITPSYSQVLRKAEEDESLPYDSYAQRIARFTEVHRILAKICGNHFFEAIVTSMLRLTAEVVLAVDPDHESLHGPGEHHTIVTAVIGSDAEGASSAMTRHLKRFSESLIGMEKIYRQRFSL
ncbi:MAG: FadR family transcriptional regulator [Deltaproteobacteria bacterium]|nr:FadR family transcriptional regulator [Deltaproteobacteria bacterium]